MLPNQGQRGGKWSYSTNMYNILQWRHSFGNQEMWLSRNTYFFVFSFLFSRKSVQMSSKNIDIRCSRGWLGVSFARVMARSIVLIERFRFQWFYHLCFGNNTSFQHPIVTKVVWWHGGLRGYCFLNGVPHAPSNYIYCQQTEDHNWWNNQTRYLVKFGIFGK